MSQVQLFQGEPGQLSQCRRQCQEQLQHLCEAALLAQRQLSLAALPSFHPEQENNLSEKLDFAEQQCRQATGICLNAEPSL